MTLVIMAAGMGSRYGGLKQLDPLGPGGEFLVDYSIYDAIRAGFDHVVFVIKEENLELFRETVGKRIEDKVRVDYAFQKLEDIPAGFSVPEGRVKPYGTAHAVYCCRNCVNEPFAVINSDDFYGREAFTCLGGYLKEAGKSADGVNRYCMAGYMLKNTLTENGTVSRGVCTTDEDNYLTTIVEHTKLERVANGRVINHGEDGIDVEVSENASVSMNCWGFTPEYFKTLEQGMTDFMEKDIPARPEKAEYYILTAVQNEIDRGSATVKVLKTTAKWFGVTYRDDRPGVVAAIRSLIDAGVYPEKLWN